MSRTIFPCAIQHARLSELDRDGWLAARREGIGGSDAAALLGLNPYSSPFSVYIDKRGEFPPEDNDNLSMRIGRELEDTVARMWCEDTGKEVRKLGFMYRNVDRSWQLANIDRGVVGENAGLECKTTSSVPNIRKIKEGEYPDTYYAQCVHYMAVTGADRWYLAVLVLGFSKSFHTYVIERDEEEIAALNEIEERFWVDNVQAGKPPLADGYERTDDYIRAQYPESDDELTLEIYGCEQQIETYMALKAEAKKLETEYNAIAQNIKLQLGDAARGVARGYKVSWAASKRSGGVDSKKLLAEYPEAYAACAKPDVLVRTLKITEDK